jgi:hypothetical protein
MKSLINKEKWLVNNLKGDAGETCFKNENQLKGKIVTRTGIGSDYKIDDKLYEIKTGKFAKPTKKQKQEIEKGNVTLIKIKFNL